MDEATLLAAIKHNPAFPRLALLLGFASLAVAIVALIAKLKQWSSARTLGV